jgi:hypothetical protein
MNVTNKSRRVKKDQHQNRHSDHTTCKSQFLPVDAPPSLLSYSVVAFVTGRLRVSLSIRGAHYIDRGDMYYRKIWNVKGINIGLGLFHEFVFSKRLEADEN